MSFANKYEGKPCVVCGCTVRYLSNGDCIDARHHAKKSPRLAEEMRRLGAAVSAGAHIYTSTIRCRCGETIRNQRRECVACLRTRRRGNARST